MIKFKLKSTICCMGWEGGHGGVSGLGSSGYGGGSRSSGLGPSGYGGPDPAGYGGSVEPGMAAAAAAGKGMTPGQVASAVGDTGLAEGTVGYGSEASHGGTSFFGTLKSMINVLGKILGAGMTGFGIGGAIGGPIGSVVGAIGGAAYGYNMADPKEVANVKELVSSSLESSGVPEAEASQIANQTVDQYANTVNTATAGMSEGGRDRYINQNRDNILNAAMETGITSVYGQGALPAGGIKQVRKEMEMEQHGQDLDTLSNSMFGQPVKSLSPAQLDALYQQQSNIYLKGEQEISTHAKEALAGIYGLPGGTMTQQQVIGQAKASPLYGSIMGAREAGEEGILRSASATGTLRSGGTISDIYDYNRDLENQALLASYNQQIQGLTGLSGTSYAPQIAAGMSGVGSTLAAGETASQMRSEAEGQRDIDNYMAIAKLGLGLFQ